MKTEKQIIIENIIDVTRRSAQAEEINIFEMGSLSDLLPMDEAEELRKLFVANDVKVRQISNHSPENWTEVDGMKERVDLRVVDRSVIDIQTEILIFDDTVVVYRLGDDPMCVEIKDMVYASVMRGLFRALWKK